MQPNAFTGWIQQHAKSNVELGKQDPLQLGASTAQQTLQPVEHQEVHNMSPHPYLASPSRYIAPINHARLVTHQQIHQQPPQTVNPNIASAYLAPPKSGIKQ